MTRKRKQSTLEEAKTFLPNDSLELTHFIDENEECISDVGEMEEMACAFWGKLYAKPEAPSPGKIEQWFNQYRRRIPDGQAPALPTIEDVITAIRKSNNSCAGPDGVIFAVYRNKRIIETAAELLHAALCWKLMVMSWSYNVGKVQRKQRHDGNKQKNMPHQRI